MKKVIVKNIKIKKEWIDEEDYRLSATSKGFYEGHPDGSFVYEITSADFEAEGVAGTLEKGCRLNDFEFAFADSVYEDIEGTTVSIDDVKNFVYCDLTSQVEIRDDYGNILLVYRADRDLNPPLWRKATHKEVRDFILATEGYDIDDVENKVDYKLKYEEDKEFYDKAIKERIDELKNFQLYKVGKNLLPTKYFSWLHIVEFSSFFEEYKTLQEQYEKIYPDVIWVETKAWNFLALKTDKVWNVKVPDNKKGLFIGKCGANIKALAKKYGVRINLV